MSDKVVLEAQIDTNVGEVVEGIDKATKSAKELDKATRYLQNYYDCIKYCV
jgi:hypothetical protein